MRAYIDSRFASMAWSAGSFWPSGSAVPGHSFYLGETSGVFDGGIQGSGPQQGKAFREVKGRFNTYNDTANDIVVGAKFSLTGYTHAAVSGSALVTQHAAEKTPLRVKVTYRVRYSSVNPVTGTFYYGSETNGSSAIYSVASGSATQTIEFPNEPDLVFYTTSNMERWGNNFTRGVVIQLAPDCEIPEADISMTSGAGAVSFYVFNSYSDLDQFLASDKFMFVPSGVTENKTITKSQSNWYYLLVPEMTYLKADASATVTVSTKCGQSLKLVFSRKKAVPALEAVPAEFTVPNTKGADRIAVRGLAQTHGLDGCRAMRRGLPQRPPKGITAQIRGACRSIMRPIPEATGPGISRSDTRTERSPKSSPYIRLRVSSRCRFPPHRCRSSRRAVRSRSR